MSHRSQEQGYVSNEVRKLALYKASTYAKVNREKAALIDETINSTEGDFGLKITVFQLGKSSIDIFVEDSRVKLTDKGSSFT